MRLDLLVQRRYGFLYASFVTVLVWLAVLRALPSPSHELLAPFIVFTDIGLVGFFFIAGLVLYEKGEATLNALVVTPLRFWEYLGSKLLTLTLLAVVQGWLLLALTVGLSFNWLYAALGTALMSLIALLVGFIAVAPFKSFSSYLIPSNLFATVLYLPLIAYFEVWQSPLFYLLPTHGAALLLRGSLTGLPVWQLVYAVLAGSVWIFILGSVARAMFDRYIVERRG